MAQVIVLVGLPGSGKSTASTYIQRKKIPVIRMGFLTEKLLKRNKIPINEQNEKIIRTKLRKDFGADVYAKAVFPEIKKKLVKHKIVVVEGMRSLSEYNYFKKKLFSIKIIFINLDVNICYHRLYRRKERPLKLSEFKNRCFEEQNLGLLKFKKMAHFILDNSLSKRDLYQKINKILASVNLMSENK